MECDRDVRIHDWLGHVLTSRYVCMSVCVCVCSGG